MACPGRGMRPRIIRASDVQIANLDCPKKVEMRRKEDWHENMANSAPSQSHFESLNSTLRGR